MPLTLLAVHAHPDDESITTGGVLARYSAEGIHTIVLTCTGGEVGEISHPSIATPETLPAVRGRELEAALGILGVRESVKLGYRDSGMMGTEDNLHPNAFWQANLHEAARGVVAVVRRLRPDVIVAYNERGDYGHPDHINAHRVAARAFHGAGDPERYPLEDALAPWTPRKLYYSAWPKSSFRRMRELMAEGGVDPGFAEEEEGFVNEWGTPDELITTTIDVSAYVDTKRKALLAHASQMPADGWFMRMPEPVWRTYWNTEYFRRIESHVPAPEREDDLFAGLR